MGSCNEHQQRVNSKDSNMAHGTPTLIWLLPFKWINKKKVTPRKPSPYNIIMNYGHEDVIDALCLVLILVNISYILLSLVSTMYSDFPYLLLLYSQFCAKGIWTKEKDGFADEDLKVPLWSSWNYNVDHDDENVW